MADSMNFDIGTTSKSIIWMKLHFVMFLFVTFIDFKANEPHEQIIDFMFCDVLSCIACGPNHD